MITSASFLKDAVAEMDRPTFWALFQTEVVPSVLFQPLQALLLCRFTPRQFFPLPRYQRPKEEHSQTHRQGTGHLQITAVCRYQVRTFT